MENSNFPTWGYQLTLYTLRLECTFSILFSMCFLNCWPGEFIYQSRSSLVGDYFPLFSWPECLIQWWYFKEKLDASHCYELKGQKNQLNFAFIIPASTTPYLPLHQQLSQKGKGDENLFSVCDKKKTHKTLKKWLTSHPPFLPFISVCISLGVCLPCKLHPTWQDLSIGYY